MEEELPPSLAGCLGIIVICLAMWAVIVLAFVTLWPW